MSAKTVDPAWLERLRAALSYDPETGKLHWKYTRSGTATAGSVAGYRHPLGYCSILFEEKRYQGHRLAWVLTYGTWPERLDHIDRHPENNRLANLRECTSQQNARNRSVQVNNTTGYTGVSLSSNGRKWVAFIKIGGKHHHLGTFPSAEEAAAVRRRAEVRHFGAFARNASVPSPSGAANE